MVNLLRTTLAPVSSAAPTLEHRMSLGNFPDVVLLSDSEDSDSDRLSDPASPADTLVLSPASTLVLSPAHSFGGDSPVDRSPFPDDVDHFVCDQCSRAFASAQHRRAHMYNYHRSEFKFEDRLTLHRNHADDFQCPWSVLKGKKCLGDWNTLHGMERHLKAHHASADLPNMDDLPQPADEPVSEQLPVQPPTDYCELGVDDLFDWNLMVVQANGLRMLVCTHCGRTVKPVERSIIRHVRLHQAKKLTKASTTQMLYLIFNFNLSDETAWLESLYMNPGMDLIPGIPALKTTLGFRCMVCPFYTCNMHIMTMHKTSNHAELESDDVFDRCLLQYVAPGAIHKPIGVLAAETPTSNHCSFQELLQADDDIHQEALAVNTEMDARQLSLWLVRSKWHLHFKHLVLDHSVARVLKPINDKSIDGDHQVIQCLKPLCISYMDKIHELLGPNGVSFRTRVFLVGRDLFARGQREFRPLQTVASRNLYARLMSRLLTALVRSQTLTGESWHHVVVPHTDDQREAIQCLCNAYQESVALETLLIPLHKLLLAIFTPEIPVYASVVDEMNKPVCRFLLLNAIRNGKDAHQFKEARHVTSPTAAMIFWIRGCILLELGATLWQGSNTPELTVERKKTLEVYLLNKGDDTPMQALRDIIRQAYACASSEVLLPTCVALDDTFSCCTVKGKKFFLRDFVAMIGGLINEAEHWMHMVLMGYDSSWLDEVLKRDPVECWENRSTGYWFGVSDDFACPFTLRSHCLANHRDQFVKPNVRRNNQVVFNDAGVKTWMISCQELETRLFLLLHFTSGQPPRSTEYSSFQLRETSNGVRSFYYAYGTIMVVQSYFKTSNVSSTSPNPVIRFLPKSLLELFMKYLVVVRPFEAWVAEKTWGRVVRDQYLNYWGMSGGRNFGNKEYTGAIRNYFTKYCGSPLGLSSYRQYAAFLTFKIQNLDTDNLPYHETAGHSEATASRHYVRGSTQHRGLSTAKVLAFHKVALKWHSLVMPKTEPVTENIDAIQEVVEL